MSSSENIPPRNVALWRQYIPPGGVRLWWQYNIPLEGVTMRRQWLRYAMMSVHSARWRHAVVSVHFVRRRHAVTSVHSARWRQCIPLGGVTGAHPEGTNCVVRALVEIPRAKQLITRFHLTLVVLLLPIKRQLLVCLIAHNMRRQ